MAKFWSRRTDEHSADQSDNVNMAAPGMNASAASSPSKRKRVEKSFFEGREDSDVESCDIPRSLTRTKKARFFKGHLEDELSNSDVVSIPTLAETATAASAPTETPFTDRSSQPSKSKIRPKKYLCTFAGCDKAFDRPIRLQTHINSHTGERPHACPEQDCDKRFFKVEHLKQHVHDKHTVYEAFVCTYRVHDESAGEIAECGKTFPTSSKLKRHVAQHEQKAETTCSWEGCGKVFRKQETLQRHMKKDHLNELPYQCLRDTEDGNACGESFATIGLLKGHEAQVHDEPRYLCDICNSTSMEDEPQDPKHRHTGSLRETQMDHDDGILRTMSLREASNLSQRHAVRTNCFATYAEFQFHMKECHPPKCPACGKVCKSNRELTAHIEIEHPEPNSVSGPKELKRFLCPFDDCARAQLNCGFTRKGNLDVHIRTVHSGEKDFTCGEYNLADCERLQGWNGQGCGMSLRTKQNLIAHIRTQHLGVPAAVGARTGLRAEDRKRRVRTVKKDPDATPAEPMEAVTASAPAEASNAMSMLTGIGYEDGRPFGCLLKDSLNCQLRFVNEYNLAYHLESSHGWSSDQINNALQSNAPPSGPGIETTFVFEPEQSMGTQLEQGIDAMSDVARLENLDPQLQGMVV